MKVLVDTSVWSLAFRKKNPSEDEKRIINELKEIIRELRVVLIGPIRQELLSGISNEIKFQSLKEKMKAFDDLVITPQDYENAAKIYNDCRKNGIQGSHVDYLICSIARSNNISIFSTDKDFNNYNQRIELKLHQVRTEI